MRLLAFADTHGSVDRATAVGRKAEREDADLVVCAGDFTHFGNRPVEAMAPVFLAGRRVLSVPGNHEPPGVLDEVAERFPAALVPLDDDVCRVGGVRFCGHGARALVFEAETYDETGVLEGLAGRVERARADDGEDRPLVVVTHVPPDGVGLGSSGEPGRRIRAFCDRLAPDLVVAGHVHAAAGRSREVDGTRYVNPGPRGMLLVV